MLLLLLLLAVKLMLFLLVDININAVVFPGVVVGCKVDDVGVSDDAIVISINNCKYVLMLL